MRDAKSLVGRLRPLLAQGDTQAEAARKLGVSRQRVGQLVAEHSLVVLARHHKAPRGPKLGQSQEAMR